MRRDGSITVMFLIPYFGIGGTEQQLLDLVRGIDKARFQPLVISLYPGGPLEPEIRKVQGAELISLDRKSKFDFTVLFKVFSLLRKKQVDIIQPFLTPATFFALLPAIADRTTARIVTERGRVPQDARLGTRFYWAFEDVLSRFADMIVSNSDAGKRRLIERGIQPARIRVIHNGINFDRLIPKPDKVIQIRAQMGVPPGGQVVGIVGRLNAVKDHATFLQAATLVSKQLPQTRFAVVGDGELRGWLQSMARELNIDYCTTFFGSQQDVGSYISAFDIACSSSLREGFSNAILEAMALGKLVVATDVGGNREIVYPAETGILVPTENPRAMADSLLACLSQPQWAQEMGLRAQQMVVGRFGQDRMVQEYQALYEDLIGGKNRKAK